MKNSLRNIWDKISTIGLNDQIEISSSNRKRIVFFNQVLFVGVFAILAQIASVWPLIGSTAFLFLIVLAAAVNSLYLNKKGKFFESKRLFLFVLYFMGTFMTFFIGGSGYYHLMALSLFSFSLILVDFKTERILLLIGIPFVTMSVLIGELEWFNVPVFEPSSALTIMKFTNIVSLFFVTIFLIVFIIKLNEKNEAELMAALEEISIKTDQVDKSKKHLEKLVEKRTDKLIHKNQKLEEKSAEKEVLIQEINHRVKNNLQVIIGLLNLQISKSKSEDAKDSLEEVRGKLMAISLVHKKMYQKENFKSVDFRNYVLELIENVKENYKSEFNNFEVKVPDETTIDVEVAIPLGLILNEIITNFNDHVYKHVGEKAKFILNWSEIDDGVASMIYMDNGPGFSNGVLMEDESLLGFQLINTLVEQIDGQVDIYNDGGAVYVVSFPVD